MTNTVPKVVPLKTKNRRSVMLAISSDYDRELIAQRLRTHGYEVLSTNNGEHVLDVMEEQTFPYLVLDEHLSDYSGLEVGKLLKLIWLTKGRLQECRVILGASVSLPSEEQRAAGVHACVQVPFSEHLSDLLQHFVAD